MFIQILSIYHTGHAFTLADANRPRLAEMEPKWFVFETSCYRPLSRRLDRVIQNESGDSVGGNV